MNVQDISKGKRNLVVAVMLVSAFVAILNQTLLNTAIPEIMVHLNIDANQGQWLMTGFMLVNGVMIPATAFLMDKFNTRPLYLMAMLSFTIGTLVAALSPNFSILMLARVLQAMGAGVMMPLMQFVLFNLFPKEKRGFAMGMAGLVISFAPALGPTLSGYLVDNFSWRSPFYSIIPFSVIALAFGAKYLTNISKPKDVHLDVPSLILSTVGFGSLLYGFSSAGSLGFTSATVIITLIIGVVTLIVFIFRQLKLETPLLNIRVFKYKTFALTTVIGVFSMVSLIGPSLLMPMYMQDARGYTALISGLLLLPGAIVTGIMSLVTGRLFDKYGAKWLAITGFSIISVTTLMLAFLSTDTSLAYLIIVYTVRMFGVSMIMMPVNTAGLNAIPNEVLSHGTAMMNTLRTIAGSIGTGILVTIMSIGAKNFNPSKEQLEVASSGNKAEILQSQAMIHGINIAFLVLTVIVFFGVVLSIFLKTEKINRNTRIPNHSK
ncbi:MULTISPECIES: MDR family MFS transporter [Mammaliicoccus]|uniref:Multidrug efflux MFS transporter n=1 Tax=Mammaliicoccus fleurettii TaxID=150056 RepID=A0ABS5MN04_9STAP|nr:MULTISPECIES: MDR family MFS transporter [Mammaliicoccus]HCN61364.1 MFS transporter [Staphylococcus sp.]MBL0847309.1 multidrug efflux MFS transporter [Mammaliicoccus fleurettii]MBO3061636.1 multidrug efflux MFS transporter [Mammaliicoccus fleurettii]MBS3672045.1 multidrug efflux MFS transporter [Mammaliicoccus fleurettii]MBS3697059.1 multidrug efflux MFS transporter [Mammaliicoccus fleurettii]